MVWAMRASKETRTEKVKDNSYGRNFFNKDTKFNSVGTCDNVCAFEPDDKSTESK